MFGDMFFKHGICRQYGQRNFWAQSHPPHIRRLQPLFLDVMPSWDVAYQEAVAAECRLNDDTIERTVFQFIQSLGVGPLGHVDLVKEMSTTSIYARESYKYEDASNAQL